MKRVAEPPPNVKPPLPFERGQRKRLQATEDEDRHLVGAIDLNPATYENYVDLWALLRDPDIKHAYEAGRDDSKSFRPDCWPISCRQFLDYVTSRVGKVSQAQVVAIAIDLGVNSIINRLRHPNGKAATHRAKQSGDLPTDYLEEAVYLRDLISDKAKDLSTAEGDLLTILKDFKIPFNLPSAAGQKGGLNTRVKSTVIDKASGIGKKVGSAGWDFAVLAFMQAAVDLDDADTGTVINPGHKDEMVRCLDGFIDGVRAKAKALRVLSIEFGLLAPAPKRGKK